jgi:predicted Zn-dependent protease
MKKPISLILLASLGLAGCQGMQVGGVDLGALADAGGSLMGARVADEDEEKAIGEEAARQLLSERAVLDNTEVQHYVSRVGGWLALQTERSELDWHFAVLDDDNINAWATPGGYVFITTGMLSLMESEAELAGVLGHEMAHVLERHHLEAIRKEAGMRGVMKLGMVAWQASQAKDGGGTDADEAAMMSKVEESVGDLYARGLSRGDEMEADRQGMVIAARAGYDPWALVAVLQKIQQFKADNSVLTRFFRTHPNTGERIEAMEPLLMDSYLADVSGKTLAKRFQQHMH